MKLVKIFSNKNFINVSFNEQFNVVLATIHDRKDKKDTHNLGKTSLIRVIDFLLLSSFQRGKGLLGKEIFIGQIFYGEIKLNVGGYLVIRRSIDSPTKISFKKNDLPLPNFTPPKEWDDEDIPFKEAKEKLNEYLAFDVATNWGYRKSITYFLRTQNDYNDVFQLSKFKGKHIDWKPFIFELLGFDGRLITTKLELEEEAEEQRKAIRLLEKEANVDIKEKDRILGLIDIKQKEKEDTEKTIDKFNFYTKDSSVTQEMIEKLDFEIQTLNTERYRISYDISKTEESLKKSLSDVNTTKLKELYKEVKLYFPEELNKQYEKLEQFNLTISKERRKYLSENLQKLKDELSDINNNLQQLEQSKSEKLMYITEKDSYDKFKYYQKQLASLEAEINILNEKLKLIDKSASIEANIKVINEKINKSIDKISEALKERKHAEINKTFNKILTNVVRTNALLSIKQNKQGNIEFTADYVNLADSTSTSESEGTSYKKLLCMAFDLSLLIYYSKNSFFRFVYHDGILEGLDDRIKIQLLNTIKEICIKYDLQHIITLIDSDIPTLGDGSKYHFELQETCLELNDFNDEGKLFKQSF